MKYRIDGRCCSLGTDRLSGLVAHRGVQCSRSSAITSCSSSKANADVACLSESCEFSIVAIQLLNAMSKLSYARASNLLPASRRSFSSDDLDKELTMLWLVETDTDSPAWANTSTTSSGVEVECKKIPKMAGRALHFWLVLNMIIDIMMTRLCK